LQSIERSERATLHCSGMHLRIAIDYSAQYSLLEACRRLQLESGIDKSRFVTCLAEVDHAAVPAPTVDLLIRTGGEQRLSDFLLWECAYAELHFVNCLWPEFDASAFEEALAEFARRDRRFGRIASQPEVRSNHG
jgi:undecaprenyl diphosphate synthase